MNTIANKFNKDHNSLNGIRLVLALSVIVSHSFAIGMFGPEPQMGGTKLGTWAVLGFFAVSGFLITGSRLSGKPVAGYYINRVMRIFPGFLVCLAIVAFVLAPLSLLFDSRASWSIVNSVTYVLRNFFLYPPQLSQPAIGGTLQHVPYQGYWNGSMWTLFWEFGCYLFIGLAVSLIRRRLLPAILIAVFIVSTGLSVMVELGVLPLPDVAGRALPLLAAFMAGALAFLFRDTIRFNVVTIGASALAIAVVSLVGMAHSLAAAPLAILVLWLGSVVPPTPLFEKGRPDLSYGTYIYAWPVQQYLMLIFGPELGLPLMILLSIVITLPLAYLSFVLIEQPAQKRGHRLARELKAKEPKASPAVASNGG
jgi:peptidoglycan/LPS O-acetylase OafA/YrhL